MAPVEEQSPALLLEAATPVVVEEPLVSDSRDKGCCTRPVMICGGMCVLFLVIFAILVPTVLAPSVAQTMVDGSTLTVLSAQLSDPQADSVHLVQFVELNNAGPMDCVMKKTTVTVGAHMPDGTVVEFGSLEMPEIAVKGGGPTRVEMNQRLHITNPQGMAAATALLLMGNEGIWVMNGKVDVHAAMGLVVTVNLNKRIVMPASPLEHLSVTNNVTMGHTTKDSIELFSGNTYISTSIMEIGSLGKLSFDVYSLDGKRVGKSIINDFKVNKGFNFDPRVATVLERTSDNTEAIAMFFTNFNNGIDQQVELRGPNDVPEWLKMNIKQTATVQGIRNKKLVRASLAVPSALNGWKLDVQGSDGRTEKGKMVHGVYSAASNPFNVPVTQKNWLFQVDLDEPIGYRLSSFLLGKHTCPVTKQFTQLPAMKATKNGKVVFDDQFTVPAYGVTSTLLAVEPQEGRAGAADRCTIATGFGCCFASLTIAAACRAHEQGRRDVSISMRGSVDLVVGAFTTRISMSDSGIPLMYADGILAPTQFGIITPMDCTSFEWLDRVPRNTMVKIIEDGDNSGLVALVGSLAKAKDEAEDTYCLIGRHNTGHKIGCNFRRESFKVVTAESLAAEAEEAAAALLHV